jgi:hypothetical protein
MVWLKQLGLILTVWPEEICTAEIVFAFGHMWLVLIFPREYVAVKMEDLFLCPANEELALLLVAWGVGKIQGTQACLGEDREEDIPPFAKVALQHFDAWLQISGGHNLVQFRVSDHNHVVISDLWCDGDIAGGVEMNW